MSCGIATTVKIYEQCFPATRCLRNASSRFNMSAEWNPVSPNLPTSMDQHQGNHFHILIGFSFTLFINKYWLTFYGLKLGLLTYCVLFVAFSDFGFDPLGLG